MRILHFDVWLMQTNSAPGELKVNGSLAMRWRNNGCFIVITMLFFEISDIIIYLKLIPSREVTIKISQKTSLLSNMHLSNAGTLN